MQAEKILEFEDISLLIDWLEKNLTGTDSLLLKGSRGLRMDQIVTALEAKK
jgi:UDP-N-acetylmuramyl pentapeptide synthase